MTPASSPAGGLRLRAAAAMAALGVVFGDIGTSPLYAFEQCFSVDKPATREVLGVFSLVFWALLLVVCVKYLLLVMRADNRGEGGILALLALLDDPERVHHVGPSRLALLALVGAALLYGDGLITPAISVISAVEGLEVAAPALSRLVVPITVVILIALFRFQRRGTAGVAGVFGPTMVVWFLAIGLLGASQLLGSDRLALQLVNAIDPRDAFFVLTEHGLRSLAILGSLVLVVTGVEALYADLGHFGASPIRRAWYVLVYPSLLLNYAGQAALVLERGYVGPHPFFDLAPGWGLLPLVILSTAATVIASQALISGVFSLTEQASQLGYAPRFHVVHTSDTMRGQVYLPAVNAAMACACIAIVLAFRSSNALGAAYGVAVTGTMTVTSVLFFSYVRSAWGWSLLRASAIATPLLVMDLGFLTGNLGKIASGGWVPLAVALVLFTLMTTWARGRREVAHALEKKARPLTALLSEVREKQIERVPGTAVYWTVHMDEAPPLLERNLSAHHVLHERIVLVTVLGSDEPRLPARERAAVSDLGSGFHRVEIRMGFVERPTLPLVLESFREQGLHLAPQDTLFFLGRYAPVATGEGRMAHWRKRLFGSPSRARLRRVGLLPESGLPGETVPGLQ